MQDEVLAAKAYGNPFGFAVEYGLDTLPRQALQRAQDEAQVSLTCCLFLYMKRENLRGYSEL